MADMLNHSAEPNCEITFDDMGNCQVLAMYDIPAGMPLTISYGDPTNPTPVSVDLFFVWLCVDLCLCGVSPRYSNKTCIIVSLLQIFAQFGFLPSDCTTLFCKAMHLEPYIKELGIDFKDLLIQVETGEIAPKVRRYYELRGEGRLSLLKNVEPHERMLPTMTYKPSLSL